MKLNSELVQKGASLFGVALKDDQLMKFFRYCELLLDFNQNFNLTAITNPDEVASKHFVDSLACALVVDLNGISSIADIGSGAGLPGFAIKIACPSVRLVAIESIGKKAKFLEVLTSELKLDNVTVLNIRAEDVPGLYSKMRDSFDLATARAVGKMDMLLEYSKPLIKPGGSLVLWKGRDEAARLPHDLPMLKKKGFEFVKAIPYKIPLWELERFVIHLVRL